MTFYDVNERIIKFFNKQNIVEQRAELIHIIQKCLIFEDRILFDTGLIVFVFDINEKLEFDLTLLDDVSGQGMLAVNNENKSEVNMLNYFKWYFLNMAEFTTEVLNKMNDTEKMLMTLALNRIRIINDIFVQNINLKIDENMIEANSLLNALNIKYDIRNKTNMIVFVDTFKLDNFETKQVFIK
jgi:hypothetical protein